MCACLYTHRGMSTHLGIESVCIPAGGAHGTAGRLGVGARHCGLPGSMHRQ